MSATAAPVITGLGPRLADVAGAVLGGSLTGAAGTCPDGAAGGFAELLALHVRAGDPGASGTGDGEGAGTEEPTAGAEQTATGITAPPAAVPLAVPLALVPAAPAVTIAVTSEVTTSAPTAADGAITTTEPSPGPLTPTLLDLPAGEVSATPVAQTPAPVASSPAAPGGASPVDEVAVPSTPAPAAAPAAPTPSTQQPTQQPSQPTTPPVALAPVVPLTAPTAAASAVGPTATAPPAHPVAAQLAPVVARASSGPDGVHRVVLRLHPADLGEVRVTMTVRDGALDVRLSGTAAARHHLGDALGDLRQLLEAGGTAVSSIVLREPASPGSATASATTTDGGTAWTGGTDRQSQERSERGPGAHAERPEVAGGLRAAPTATDADPRPDRPTTTATRSLDVRM